MKLIWLVGVLSLGGCTPKTAPVGPGDEAWLEQETETGADRTDEIVASDVATGPARVDRAALIAFLDRGPGHLFSLVEVEAKLSPRRQLIGWTIGSMRHSVSGLSLRSGDVVIGINGRRIVKPHDLMDVYKELRSAKQIRIERLDAPALTIDVAEAQSDAGRDTVQTE